VPFKDVLSIGLTQAAPAEIRVRVLDMNGKVWLIQSFEGVEGENEMKLNVAHLPAGSYVLEVVAGEDKLSEIIVK
jgi:hypothetical protein